MYDFITYLGIKAIFLLFIIYAGIKILMLMYFRVGSNSVEVFLNSFSIVSRAMIQVADHPPLQRYLRASNVVNVFFYIVIGLSLLGYISVKYLFN